MIIIRLSVFPSFHTRNALLGKWSKALIYCENTERYLTRLTSVSVLGLSTHSLAIAYGLLGMHDRAHALFTSLMYTEGKSSAFSIFRELNPFYNELYAKRQELAVAGSYKELQQMLDSFNYQNAIDKQKQAEEKERERQLSHVEVQVLVSEKTSNNTTLLQTVTAEDTVTDEIKGISLGIIQGLQEEIDGKQNIVTPSFSSVVEAIIKKIRAKKLIAKAIKEKQAVKLNSVLDKANGLSENGVCEGAPCASAIPKTPEAQGTISFQLSLMTGRGMDSVKAELCMLNALIAISGGEVSSNLNNTSKVLTIEEHCEDGLRCISNIFEDSNHSQISYYANTCDQVHSYIVEARLYAILATLAPAPAPAPAPTPTPSLPSSNQQNVDTWRSNQLNDVPAAVHTLPLKTKHGRQYYIHKAIAAMKKCEALGRALDAPGVLFTTGIQMVIMGLDVDRGKSILSESIEIIEYEAEKAVIEKDRRKLEETMLDEKQLKEQNQYIYNGEEFYDPVMDEEDNEDEGELTNGIRNVFDILTETEVAETVINTAINSKNQDTDPVTKIPNYTAKNETKSTKKKNGDFKYLKKNSTSFETSQIPIVSDARDYLKDYKK